MHHIQRKKEFLVKQISSETNCFVIIFSLCLRNSKVGFFSFFAVTLQKFMKISQSFHDGLPLILDNHQNFSYR